MFRGALFATFVVLFALPAIGLSQGLKGVVYKLPEGWKESTEGGARVFSPKDLKEGEIVLVILTPAMEATDGKPGDQFETVVGKANSEVKVLAKGAIETKSEGENTVCIQAMQCESEDVGKHSRIYAMLFSGKKRTLAIVIMKPEALATKYADPVMELIGSIKIKEESVDASVRKGKTPTGNTPDLYPGQEGWLPSGKGTPIPPSLLVDGKPQGIWWTTSYGTGQRAMTFVFLPSGIHASNPRYGGGMLVDLVGQKAAPGSNGVGPFSIANGFITTEHDGYKDKAAYSKGADDSGKFFKIGAATYRPVDPPTKSFLVGTWQVPGTRYVFSSDGTYEFGQAAEGEGWVAGSKTAGTYLVDGHLVTLFRADGTVEVTPIGMLSKKVLLVNGLLYQRR